MGPAATKTNLVLTGEDSLCVLSVKKSNRAIYYVPGARVSHIMRGERLTKVYFLRRMMWEGSSQVAIKEKLAPLATTCPMQAVLDASSRLAGILIRDLVVPALNGKFNKQMLMSALGYVAMSYGAMKIVCGFYLKRLLKCTGLASHPRDSG